MTKKIIYTAALSILLCACDNIDENDRLIPIEFTKSDKVVLIEEFTGVRCPNCPDGASVIAALHEHPVYGERVIPVSLYPTQLTGLTRPYNTDLRTAEARDIFAEYNVNNSLPAAMFNRRTIDDAILQTTYTHWSSYVTDIFDESGYPPVNIIMSCQYDEATRELVVNYQTQFVDEISDEVLFQVYVVENNIKTQQLSTAGIISDYVANHVLRTAINDTWGKSYGDDHAKGSFFDDAVTCTLKDTWVAENIQVVGFLSYATGNREILNATMVDSIIDEVVE